MITKQVFLSEGAAVGLSLIPAVSSIKGLSAQTSGYPAGPVRIIVAQAAGGSLDVIIRIVADHLGRTWGKQAVVLNQPSAGGVIAGRTAASAAPDGHTLLFAGASIFTVLPETQANLNFDVGEFVPVAFVAEQPMALVVSPTLGVNSLQELIALSKKQPDGLNCAVSARGGFAHLTAELLRKRSGANLNFIYYPGTAQALNDVISGRVPILVQILPGMAGAIAGGQVKLLSVMSPARLRSLPEVPTTSEAIPDFVVSGWAVLVAPRGTPAAIVTKVNDDLRAAQERAELKDKLEELGAYTRSMSPLEVAEFIRRERNVWRPLVREVMGKTR